MLISVYYYTAKVQWIYHSRQKKTITIKKGYHNYLDYVFFKITGSLNQNPVVIDCTAVVLILPFPGPGALCECGWH